MLCAGANWACSDPQKNAVTNLLALNNALELLVLGFPHAAAKRNELVTFARKTWSWLKQADAGAAGLVDWVSGVVCEWLDESVSQTWFEHRSQILRFW